MLYFIRIFFYSLILHFGHTLRNIISYSCVLHSEHDNTKTLTLEFYLCQDVLHPETFASGCCCWIHLVDQTPQSPQAPVWASWAGGRLPVGSLSWPSGPCWQKAEGCFWLRRMTAESVLETIQQWLWGVAPLAERHWWPAPGWCRWGTSSPAGAPIRAGSGGSASGCPGLCGSQTPPRRECRRNPPRFSASSGGETWRGTSDRTDVWRTSRRVFLRRTGSAPRRWWASGPPPPWSGRGDRWGCPWLRRRGCRCGADVSGRDWKGLCGFRTRTRTAGTRGPRQ